MSLLNWIREGRDLRRRSEQTRVEIAEGLKRLRELNEKHIRIQLSLEIADAIKHQVGQTADMATITGLHKAATIALRVGRGE